jgi:hypothetical protein
VDLSTGVEVRSYRDVVDSVERRIYRVDRWRLPAPQGIPVRALAYGAATLAGLLVASGLPLIGWALAMVPASARYLALPALVGWALSTLAVDGRPPHHVVAAAASFAARRRVASAVRGAPAIGSVLTPVASIQVAPAGDEARYRAGRVRGPATIALRCPAKVTSIDAGSRLRVTGLRGRPLVRATEIEIPSAARVEFE